MTAGPATRRDWLRRAAASALAVSLLWTLAHLRSGDAFEMWSLTQEQTNRATVRALRSLRPQLRTARSVLVVGVAWPFHPWLHPTFLARDLHYTGRWSMAYDPGGYTPPAFIASVPYEAIDWSDYDLIIVFRSNDGVFVGAFPPAQLQARQTGTKKLTNTALVRGLTTGQIVLDDGARAAIPDAGRGSGLVYPRGILDSSDAYRQIHGIYGTSVAEAPACCWIGPDVSFLANANPNSRSIRLTITQPAFTRGIGKRQTVNVLGMYGETIASRPVPLGVSMVTLELPRALPGGDVVVKLHFSQSIVPSDERTGPDARRLSAILHEVAVR